MADPQDDTATTAPAAAGGAPAGYDPHFLGHAVPLPLPVAAGVETVQLDYTHFSAVVRPERRLACVTGLVLDGSQRRDAGDAAAAWRFDPRLPEDQQTGPEVYGEDDLGRRHLVAATAAAWGDPETAAAAVADTAFVTNAAPRPVLADEGDDLWQGMEDHLLARAGAEDGRLVVFAGPVLSGSDPRYRGTQVPLRYFKVVVFVEGGELAALGCVLDQTPEVEDFGRLLAAARAAGEPPPLGHSRTFQVPIADVASLTGLDLTALAEVDRNPVPDDTTTPAGTGVSPSWRRVRTHDDLRWRTLSAG